MKLVDALRLNQQPLPAGAEQRKVFLVCGCTPSHLQTFLTAQLRAAFPGQRVEVRTGLFGDALGSLERLPGSGVSAAAVVLEWSDFDARLGLRQLGGWGPREAQDILETVRVQAERFREAIVAAAQSLPVALALPTLPVPPVGYTPGAQASPFELQLRECVGSLAAAVAGLPRVKVVSPQRLDRLSPPEQRHDVQADILVGFPYKLPHASAVAELLAELLKTPAPKKGIVTDLDDTLWAGLLGEVGCEGVSWDLDHRSQLHGLYQQMLRALGEAGVLIAVASKNDPARVEEAFRRPDLLLPRERIFPFEVHWGPKSESVARILHAWNISADSVVFVDDSPLELAEVQAAYPGVETILFPKNDYAATYALLGRLRDLFGKPAVTEEDGLRLESIRRSATQAGAAERDGASLDGFLEQAAAEITLSFDKEHDPRALELVNKTNQFNLNGRRLGEGDWQTYLDDPQRFVAVVSYKDKFGPLGKIAVLAGRREDSGLQVDCWVMSCRAFARRIEHRCLEQLFEHFGVDEIRFDYQATPKNGPLQTFFRDLLGGEPPAPCRLSRADFNARCPRLFHQVMELAHA